MLTYLDNYTLLLVFFGFLFLGSAILPRYLKNSYFTLPMLYVGVGFLIPIIWQDIPNVLPIENENLVEKVTEFTVILSLMAGGIKLRESLNYKSWLPTLRLLAITMPVSIILSAVFGAFWLGLSVGSAILLGAVLAPTDPVLAGEVQVGKPGDKEKDNSMRFALTSEAGLNDGLAFPFVYLAGFWFTKGFSWEMIGGWFAYEVLYKITVGIVSGWLIGRFIGRLIFSKSGNAKTTDGFLAIAITLLSYGITEFLGGYGFLAVFACAYFFRQSEIAHKYHRILHDFTGEIEKILVSAILIIFGVAIGEGMLNYISFTSVLFGLLFIFLIRPLSGIVALKKTSLNKRQRLAVSFLGIRGIGSMYYLAYGFNNFGFDITEKKILWGVVGFVILTSIIIHGLVTNKIVNWVENCESKN